SGAEADKRSMTYMLEGIVVTMNYMFNKNFSIGMATLKAVATMHMRTMNDPHHDMSMQRDDKFKKYKGYSLSTEKIAVEASHAGYSAVPSRILGQRGPVGAPAQTAESAPPQNVQEGKRLRQSYAQAKVHVRETAGLAQVDKNIDKIGKSLPKKKISAPELKPPTPDMPSKG
ncbi:MAG: hypothetical protein KGL10_08085, partial [Alphaproteobacteria bacterium]|nr:hypothetical protein [Alphaproteobacteria bacterium]